MSSREENTEAGKREHKSFWETVPGVLAGIAALITAVGGCIAILATNPILLGFFFPSPTPPPTSTSIPQPTISPSSTERSQSKDDMPYWVVAFEIRFAPEYWSIGTHEYTIDAVCPNFPDSNGTWTNTFEVSEDASLLPDRVYLRFAGVKKAPIGVAPSLDKIHPAQATAAIFGYAGETHAEAQQLSTNCTVTLSWDSGDKQVMGVQAPYYDGP